MVKKILISFLVLLGGARWAVALLRASYQLYTETRAYEWSSHFLAPAKRFEKFLDNEQLAFEFYDLAARKFFWRLIFKPKSFLLNMDMSEYYKELCRDFCEEGC